MKCPRCKKGKLYFVIRLSEEGKLHPLFATLYICDVCGRAAIKPIKEVKNEY